MNIESGRPAGGEYLTRSDVARLLGVSPNTVSRWAREGRITCQLTLGGHRRFESGEIERLRERLRATEAVART
jgi:excisionase family DNA binding protein